jgi:Flp pilus assembly protein TadB
MHWMFRTVTSGKSAGMSVETKPAADASLGELMSQLSTQTSRLVRDEMRLAQKEFQQAAKHAGIGAGLLSVAGLLAFFGVAAVLAGAIAALALVLPVWAAAVIVGAVLLAAAGVAALVSKRQIDEVSPPRQTAENVKKDIDEVKKHGQS